MVYIYQSHMGGLYVSSEEYDYDRLYCETCGDSDMLLLETDDINAVAEYLRGELDLFGSGGYDICYLTKIYEECEAILGERD